MKPLCNKHRLMKWGKRLLSLSGVDCLLPLVADHWTDTVSGCMQHITPHLQAMQRENGRFSWYMSLSPYNTVLLDHMTVELLKWFYYKYLVEQSFKKSKNAQQNHFLVIYWENWGCERQIPAIKQFQCLLPLLCTRFTYSLWLNVTFTENKNLKTTISATSSSLLWV